MKTAESFIKKEIGKLIVDLAIAKVNHWAKSELNYIRFALDQPVVIPISNTLWVIGGFYIKHLGPHQYKVSQDSTLVHIFYNKQAAVLYAALTKAHYFKTADSILAADREVAKLSDELEFYSKKLTSKSKKDPFKRQLWYTKYNDLKLKYIPAKEELEKRISSAKYIKIWDKLI